MDVLEWCSESASGGWAVVACRAEELLLITPRLLRCQKIGPRQICENRQIVIRCQKPLVSFFPVDGCVLVRVGPFIPNLGVQETDCRLQPIVLGTVCHLDVSQIIGDRSDVSEIRADLATRTQDLADTGRVVRRLCKGDRVCGTMVGGRPGVLWGSRSSTGGWAVKVWCKR